MSNNPKTLANIDVLILAGGMGTRISNVLGDVPKLLAPVAGTTYLDIAAHWLSEFDATRLILCLGHLAQKVATYVAEHPFKDLTIELSVESEPLGTAGAIRHAASYIQSDEILIINGDSWTDADLGDFLRAHHNSAADVSILCVEVADVSRYASIEIDSAGFVTSYLEKDPSQSGPGTISAGIYVFSGPALQGLITSDGPSLERDVLQRLPTGTVHGYVATGSRFIDIGTPESLKEAAIVLPLPLQNDKEA